MSKDNQITGYPSNDLYAQFMMKKDLMAITKINSSTIAKSTIVCAGERKFFQLFWVNLLQQSAEFDMILFGI